MRGGLHPRLDAERPERREAIGARIAAEKRRSGASEGPHDDHSDTELGGERQNPALGLALERAQRDLDRVEAAGPDGVLERGERARGVVRDPEAVDAPAGLLLLEPRQVLAPGDQVVHLLDLHPPEVPPLHVILPPAFVHISCPDLRGDHAVAAPSRERLAEGRLGPAIHRRRVEKRDPGVERRRDDLRCLPGVAIEGRVRPEPHDRPQPALLHRAPRYRGRCVTLA
jgi:hypothetical protein